MFRTLALICAGVTLFIIVMNAFVRVMDAGAGCADWPACYGRSQPQESASSLTQADVVDPIDVVVEQWEQTWQRYATAFVALLVFFMIFLSWTLPYYRVLAVLVSAALLMLIVGQAALTVWTMHIETMPIIVWLNYVLSLLTFWGVAWVYWRTDPLLESGPQPNYTLRIVNAVAILVLFADVLVGGWASANLAALACSDFPQCVLAWQPGSADIFAAINIFYGLESGYTGVLPPLGQQTVLWLHQVGAVAVTLISVCLVLLALIAGYVKPVKVAAFLLLLLLVGQLTLGIFNVTESLPIAVAVAHSVFGALLMLPLIAISVYAHLLPVSARLEQASTEQPAIALSDVHKAIHAELETYVEPEPESLYLRLRSQLQKTRTGIGGVLNSLKLGQRGLDEETLEDIESQLIVADVGVEATQQIIARLTQTLQQAPVDGSETVADVLKQELYQLLQPCDQPLVIPKQDTPFVILVVGVNGAGKTTTIGKLARRLQSQGHSVMLAAGDTFRAAAVEQLQTWGERNGIPVVAQHTGADAASVVFDALQSAAAKGVDVLIADTAGRLHTKSNLMEELIKIKRIMSKLDPSAPHEVLLILDAGTGQNAMSQAALFHEAVTLTGIALTKLDGTAKGGVIFALASKLGIPIRFIGVGEGIEDLQDFDAKNFIDALTD